MKYLFCILVIALASQASAQLRCIQCTNCENYANQPLVTCAHPVQPTPPAGTTIAGTTTTAVIGPTTVSTTISTPPTNPGPDGLPQLTPSPPPPATNPPPTNPNTPATNPTPPALTPSTESQTNPPGQTNPPTQAPPTDDPNAPELTVGSMRKRRDTVDIEQAAAHFSCFRVRVPRTATETQVNRGCVANAGSNNQTCWRASGTFGAPTECRLCSGEGCNSSSGLISSVLLVSFTILVVLGLY